MIISIFLINYLSLDELDDEDDKSAVRFPNPFRLGTAPPDPVDSLIGTLLLMAADSDEMEVDGCCDC